jgi:hypothetical protein
MTALSYVRTKPSPTPGQHWALPLDRRSLLSMKKAVLIPAVLAALSPAPH